ncbi:MAG: tetratricopeptide repeat protein [Methanomassiliicoccales archaeon]|nr:MAG: tetratricopeptide repeat protein [Methanomassiliicoccales archaeon]
MTTMPFVPIDLLQRPPKVLAILVHLLSREETTPSDLMRDLNLAASTYYAAIRRLTELGLVFEREGRTFPKSVIVALTPKGRNVAKQLFPLSDVLEGTLTGLRSELETLEGKVRTKGENARMVEILLSLMDMEFTAGEWDDAESHARRAFDVASALADDVGMGNSLKLLATIHHRRGIQDEAEKEAADSLEVFARVDDLGGASESHYLLGNIREKEGDHEGALKEFEESIKLAQSARDDVLHARAGLGVGRILAKRGEHEKSLKKFMESVETFERLDEVEELPRAYTSAGASAFYVDVDESLGWHEKCIALSRMIGDVVMLGYGLSNAAGCHIKKGDTGNALRCLEEASEVFERVDQKDMVVSVNIQIGGAYRQEERWAQSEDHLFQAVGAARKHGLKYELADALLNFGLMNADRGQRADAKRQLSEALEIFEALDNLPKVATAREGLKDISL